MEVVVFQEERTAPTVDPLLHTLVDAPFAVTLCTPSEQIAEEFQRLRRKPFTRVLQNSSWQLPQLPSQTQSVETNFLQILAWRQARTTQRLEAFFSATQQPQASVMLFLLSARGLRLPEHWSRIQEWILREKNAMAFGGADGELHMISIPSHLSRGFVGAWLKRHVQESQDMIDELSVMPLTLQVFQEKVKPREGRDLLQRVAGDATVKFQIHTVEEANSRVFFSESLRRLAGLDREVMLASTLVPEATGPSVGAWVFFGLVCALVVLGVGMASSQRLRHDQVSRIVQWEV